MNILDWLLKHPVMIFVIIMAASSLIKQMASSGKAPPANGPRPFGGGDGNTDDNERTRRLQEEIRRKIAERRGHPMSPPPVVVEEPESVFTAPSWEPAEEPSPYKLPEPPPLVQTVTINPVLERQRELAEQLAVLEAQRAAIDNASWAVTKPVESEATADRLQADDMYGLRALRNARSLRKAIILREVLGPPVALR